MKGGLFPIIRMAALSAVMLLPSGYAYPGSVTINLEGQIDVNCALDASSSRINLAEIAATGSKVVPFRVRCNTPFRFALTSQNGALKTNYDGALSPDFTASIPYNATVTIPTNTGGINASCPSSALRGLNPSCTFPASEEGIALEGDASLTVSWAVTKELVAGTYSDTVVLSIGPQI